MTKVKLLCAGSLEQATVVISHLNGWQCFKSSLEEPCHPSMLLKNLGTLPPNKLIF